MKRRTFLRNSSLASIAISVVPTDGFSTTLDNETAYSLKESVVLKEFDDEQEESPSLVTDGDGTVWAFTLRRLGYPVNGELISTFINSGDEWKESSPVTEVTGEYESPTASCAKGGTPIVAWSEKRGSEWCINVSHHLNGEFTKPYCFNIESGRSINPVVISPDSSRSWIAWEVLCNGIFSIYISRYCGGEWSNPVVISDKNSSCFTPAIAEGEDGNLYITYGKSSGFHQNIELSIVDGESLKVIESTPVAVGGGRKDRVNINAHPALAFDKKGRLWISYENNRDASRLDDGDNYTGDRCCAVVSYINGKIVEVEGESKWLFRYSNDHTPTFIKDGDGNLFLATHSGGNFEKFSWKYRVSQLDPVGGWQAPITIFKSKNQGSVIPPAVAFNRDGYFWISTNVEKSVKLYEPVVQEGILESRISELVILKFRSPKFEGDYRSIEFKESVVEEFTPGVAEIGTLSGHPRVDRRTVSVDGERYTLLYGNLHEHTNDSNCWPAGTDGTLHEEYRFGMYSEGYDFVGLTDHARSTNEVHWRKSIRIADFYNESESFIAIPAVEWTLQSDAKLDKIEYGAGHYNVIFQSSEDARKYIRNRHEIFCPQTPESANAAKLWELLAKKDINAVTIPHHPADIVHPVDWSVTDPNFVTTVELFQCRGNSEYRGCPREKNLERHTPTTYDEAYVDYALRERGYKMGFIGSGDHCGMGIGLAALWVKEVSRKGIIEALKSRRTFATTGDKMFVNLKIAGAIVGEDINYRGVPKLEIEAEGQYPLESVEILRNSRVIKSFSITDGESKFSIDYEDSSFRDEKKILYYYVRVTQKSGALAWSSPIWIES